MYLLLPFKKRPPVKCLIENFRRDVQHLHARFNRRVVDQNVGLPEGRARLLDQTFMRRQVGKIGLNR